MYSTKFSIFLLIFFVYSSFGFIPSWFKDENQIGDTICPDGQSKCPLEFTCCVMPGGQYGCCPLSKAVCCNDKVHCCPQDFVCDVQSGKCNQRNGQRSIPWISKVNSEPIRNSNDEKPKINSNSFSENFYDDDDSFKYDVDQEGFERQFQDPVVCPGGKMQCPAATTCCLMASGDYGCCPLTSAVCCEDKLHCCPAGTTCDLQQQKCVRQDLTFSSWSRNFPAQTISDDDEDENPVELNLPKPPKICPDRQSQCPFGFTCCPKSNGDYGCCPVFNAVYCGEDHCCPEGTKCDLERHKCTSPDGPPSPWLQQISSERISLQNNVETSGNDQKKLRDIVCPDQESSCPDGTTCCELQSGEWGCCPMPQAVCCSDKAHCCPHDTTCDLEHSRCTKQDGTSTPMEKKLLAAKHFTRSIPTQTPQSVSSTCPDRNILCPKNSTCCPIGNGKFGCCPFKKAVCCSDPKYCCPASFQCDLEKRTCVQDETGAEVDWAEKFDATEYSEEKRRKDEWYANLTQKYVQCDDKSQCPDQFTCCQMESGKMGCCPFQDAVCCSDQIHCCPSKMVCDVQHGKCKKADNSVAILWEKVRIFHIRVDNVEHEPTVQLGPKVCPDHRHSCLNGQKCCPNSKGDGYGCCPDPLGECCGDSANCCQYGWRCTNDGSGRCWKPAFHQSPYSGV